jgi:hypothetical protein
VTRIGVKPVLAFGMTTILGGLLWFTQISVDGSYSADLLGGFLLIGVGLGFSFVPVSIAALAGVTQQDAGLASGLINTSQQIGGALGVAIAATIANTHTKTLLAEGSARGAALTGGFDWAFWVGSTFAIVGLVVTLLILRRSDVPAVPAS